MTRGYPGLVPEPRGDPEQTPGSPQPVTRRGWIRWVVGAVLLVVLGVEVILVYPSLAEAVRRLTDVNWGWVAAALVAEAVSISSFARLQRGLLAAAGVPVRQRRSLAVVYAANAMSVTLPGGPIFATTFTYRQSRRWGASPVVASWQLAMSGVLSTGLLALLGLGAALTVGGTAHPVGLAVAGVLLLVLVFGVRFVVAHPDSLLAVGRSVLTRVNRLRRRPRLSGLDVWRDLIGQLETVRLGRRSGAVTLTWAAVNWIADIATLWLACLAAGAEPSLASLVIAYAAGKAVSTLPLLPGGIGVVEGALTAALVAGGLAASAALPGVIIYRIISFFLVAAVGWVVFAFMFRTGHDDHPDDTAPDHPATPFSPRVLRAKS